MARGIEKGEYSKTILFQDRFKSIIMQNAVLIYTAFLLYP